jgi:hypothetical protein
LSRGLTLPPERADHLRGFACTKETAICISRSFETSGAAGTESPTPVITALYLPRSGTRSRVEGDKRTEWRRTASLLRSCVGRSDVDPTEARKATVRRFGRSGGQMLNKNQTTADQWVGVLRSGRGDRTPLEIFIPEIRGLGGRIAAVLRQVAG